MEPVTPLDPGTEPVVWIDEQERPLGVVTRREMRRRNLLHSVTSTFVFGSDGRLFVQQRAQGKDVYPGLWDLSVGGTVTSGESYAANACREVAEELGVTRVPLFRLFRHRFRDQDTNSLIEVYACIYDGPIRLQAEEVAAGEWQPRDAVAALARSSRCCPDSRQAWRLYREQERQEGALGERIAAGRLRPAGFAGGEPA